MQLKGAHGTCASNAEKIKRDGFSFSAIGLKGSGVYFWAYPDDDQLKDYAEALAKAWWSFYKNYRINHYRNCANQSCAVIHVELATKDGIFLDLEGHDLRHRVIIYVNRIYSSLKRNPDERKRKMLSKAFDLFVKDIEEELGNKIDIVHVAVAPPKYFDYPIEFDIRGFPSCYVVKNANCIKLVSSNVF